MRRKTTTSLPKHYLSWSQIDLVERNPNEYVERYIYDKAPFESDYTRFGTEVHNVLAKGRVPFDLPGVPLYPETEFELRCELKRKSERLELFGILDGIDTAEHVVGEYKTATDPWPFSKAFSHGQNRLYALMYYKVFGLIPTVALTCLETVNNLGTLELTGRVHTHILKYTILDMLKMEARVWQAHDKIIALVEGELTEVF